LLSRHINIQETDTDFFGHLTNMRFARSDC
jgi:hypothetical protein